MKKKNTRFKRVSWLLLVAMFNLQVSPVWANKNAGGDGDKGDSGDNKGGDKGDPVDTRSGNNFFTEIDFSFNTPGVPLSFTRQYNSIETYDSPVGPGWSHSMDWRLHEAREIICKIVPPITNENFKVNLWEGTQLLADGQNLTNSVLQTNLLTVIPEFYFGAPITEPVDAYVEQPGGKYFIDLNELAVYGFIGGTNPDPVTSLESMDGDTLSSDGTSYETNSWLQVYEANGNSTRFWDNDANGVYQANDKNWRIVVTNGNFVLQFPEGIQRVFNDDGRMIRYQDGWGRGISFTYSNDLLQRAEHDNGQAIQFSYTDTHVSGIDAGADLDMIYTYTNGMLETITRDLGLEQHIYSYQYTDSILTKKIDPAGHEYNFSYESDANGKLTHKAIAGYVGAERWLDQSLVYRSETLTDFTSHSRGLDLLERMAYSSKTGRLTDNFGPGIGNADAETRGIHYGYNSNGDRIEERLFDNNIEESVSVFTDYDSQHNPVTNAVAYNSTNRTFMSAMDWNNKWMLPSELIDAEGDRIELKYENGSIKRHKHFYNATNSYDTVYGYTNGLLLSVKNANNHTIKYTYDSRGYQVSESATIGSKRASVYDANGNLQSLEILPEGSSVGTGRITQYHHNALGWLESVVDADGRGITNKYNALGYLTNTVDRAGRPTDYRYDSPTIKLFSITEYLEQGGSNIPVRVSYDYDKWFSTVFITEPRGRYVESYQLDIQDRIVSITNIEAQVMNLEYGIGSFVNKVTFFDGSTISGRL